MNIVLVVIPAMILAGATIGMWTVEPNADHNVLVFKNDELIAKYKTSGVTVQSILDQHQLEKPYVFVGYKEPGWLPSYMYVNEDNTNYVIQEHDIVRIEGK